MPFSGEYYDASCKIKLTREFVNSHCKDNTRIDFKVIAVAQGTIPSEVAQYTYEVKDNIQPFVVTEPDSLIIRAGKGARED